MLNDKWIAKFNSVGVHHITISLETAGGLKPRWIVNAYDSVYGGSIASDNWYDLEVALESLLVKVNRLREKG